MFHRLDFGPVPFEPYTELLEPSLTDELRDLVARMQGSRIIHVNSTPVGGGVAEILRSLIPISKGLGLDTDWYVVTPPNEFFDVTKKIHNLMQGAEGALTPEESQTYTTYAGNHENIDFSPIDADVWILHDPQLLPYDGPPPGGRISAHRLGLPHRPFRPQPGYARQRLRQHPTRRRQGLLPGAVRSRRLWKTIP